MTSRVAARILPAADGKFFDLRGGAAIAIDQSEIAHARENVIARLTRRRLVAHGDNVTEKRLIPPKRCEILVFAVAVSHTQDVEFACLTA